MSADCSILSGPERVDALRRRAFEQALPLHGTLALTHRCNLRCIHCYLQPGTRPPEPELSAADWLALAGEAAEAGCFSILLTGGEPLVRPDFAEIYLGIRKMGIHVMLFTNAARVDERVVAALREAPPRLIEVTVYGATPETCRAVTGSATAHADAMRGIGLLRAARLPVHLKTVLMQANRHEFEAIRALAADGEPSVRHDAVIQCRHPGDAGVQALRVPPAEVAALEARAVPGLAEEWRRQRGRPAMPAGDGAPPLYACAAGGISFYVAADGRVQPCVSAVRHGVPWRRGNLLEAFRRTRESVRTCRAPPGHPCTDCADRVFCGSCPPVAELECGDEAGVCAYACKLARERGRLAVAAGPNGGPA